VIDFEVGEGVHAIVHGHTNCYVIEADSGLILVDAAYPRTWRLVERCLEVIKRPVDDIRCLLITHGHFDHLGFANMIRQRFGVPVWIHPGDLPIARHPYSYRPGRPRGLYPLAYPQSVPSRRRSENRNTHSPSVWPGVKITWGRPGSSRVAPSASS
jgi:glyoxylase-like metal-dependent hydrolase (beta-lactamase superfamily II)